MLKWIQGDFGAAAAEGRMGGQAPRCPNPGHMAPNPRDMAPGSSGGAFEPAAGRTGGQGPRCPNPRDMAPNPRDMAPGSSGSDFEPAAAEGRRPGFCQKLPKPV